MNIVDKWLSIAVVGSEHKRFESYFGELMCAQESWEPMTSQLSSGVALGVEREKSPREVEPLGPLVADTWCLLVMICRCKPAVSLGIYMNLILYDIYSLLNNDCKQCVFCLTHHKQDTTISRMLDDSSHSVVVLGRVYIISSVLLSSNPWSKLVRFDTWKHSIGPLSSLSSLNRDNVPPYLLDCPAY